MLASSSVDTCVQSFFIRYTHHTHTTHTHAHTHQGAELAIACAIIRCYLCYKQTSATSLK